VLDADPYGMLLGSVPFPRPTRWRRIHVRRRLNNRSLLRVQEDSATGVANVQLGGSANRCVSLGTVADATTMCANVCTYVRDVGDQTPFGGVRPVIRKEVGRCQLQPIVLCPPVIPEVPITPEVPVEVVVREGVVINMCRDVWEIKLRCHPDKRLAAEILDFIDNGVLLMFDGPILNQVFPNWQSCDALRSEVKTSMIYDISRKWKVGPFFQQPFEHFVGSLMGAFSKFDGSKPSKVKTRVIHDLSWPPNMSVNFFILAELCSVHYVTIEDAVRLVKKSGRGCLMAKIDLKTLTSKYQCVVRTGLLWALPGSMTMAGLSIISILCCLLCVDRVPPGLINLHLCWSSSC
jgi:hypothetical protein